ncbi:MAG: A24 family peptidase [Roseburia sp.]|nr:A24 family peptidase [Roseburia sp.]
MKCNIKGDDSLAILCAFLAVACLYDYGSRRIPNALLAGMLAVGLMRGVLQEGIRGGIGYGGAMLAVMLALYPFFKIGALGAGDVKLFGICAGYLPPGRVLLFLFFSLLLAAVFSIIRFIRKRDVKERFGYLLAYLAGVWQSGKWQLYIEDEESRRRAGICLAGPVLCSALMHWGGIY